jgi:hypothetical protein
MHQTLLLWWIHVTAGRFLSPSLESSHHDRGILHSWYMNPHPPPPPHCTPPLLSLPSPGVQIQAIFRSCLLSIATQTSLPVVLTSY